MDNRKFYLTQAKYESLLDEIKYLEGEGNVLLAKLLASSPGSGMGRPNDLPAHILAGEMMGHLKEIKAIVKYAEIIEEIRDQNDEIDKITLGSTASVQYEGEVEVVEYTILGRKEVDLKLNRISCFSPIGSALLDKHKGETASLKLPRSDQEIKLQILDIQQKPLDFEYGPTVWKDKLEYALMMEN